MNRLRPAEAAAGINVHGARAEDARAEPELVAEVEDEHDGHREDLEEEVLGDAARSRIGGAQRGDGRPELRRHDEQVGDEPDVGAHEADLRAERQLLRRVAGEAPGAAEADVAQADAAPGEEAGEAADGDEPVKDFALLLEVDEVREQAHGEGEEHGDERAALAVDVGEQLGGVGLLGEGGERARGAEDGGVADGDDGEEDDGVHDAGEDGVAHGLDGDDKRARGGVDGGLGAEEARVVVRDEERDEQQRDDVEDGDAPENLADGGRDGLARVGRLGGGEADELGAGEGERGGDEDVAEALEAVVGGARVGPVLAADVAVVRGAADVDDDAEEAVGVC